MSVDEKVCDSSVSSEFVQNYKTILELGEEKYGLRNAPFGVISTALEVFNEMKSNSSSLLSFTEIKKLYERVNQYDSVVDPNNIIQKRLIRQIKEFLKNSGGIGSDHSSSKSFCKRKV